MSIKRRRFKLAIVIASVTASMLVMVGLASAGNPVTGAGFTTTNESVDGTGHCQNSAVNCNIYDGKQYVWLNGGPSTAYVGDGTYFFAVLDPGSQNNPNDGSTGNLSSPNDAYTNRTFTVTGGTVSYSGTHDFNSNKIRLMPYDDTSNPGGVYIMAICSLASGYPVTASSCKYDAFKVKAGTVTVALPLTISKTAAGSYDTTYIWTTGKSCSPHYLLTNANTVSASCTITVQHDGGTVGNVAVSGAITVNNPNSDSVDINGVTDQLSDGTTCSVTGGSAQTVASGDLPFPYSCSLSAVPTSELDNTASTSWDEQFLADGSLLDAGSADFTFKNIAFTNNNVDECVTVVDDNFTPADTSDDVTLGTVCVGDPNPKTFTYTKTLTVPATGCTTYTNTATSTTNDTATTSSGSDSVQLCRSNSGGFTIGYWQNKNGQAYIAAHAAALCTYLMNYSNILTGLPSCSGANIAKDSTKVGSLDKYVYDTIKAANSAGDGLLMLKAQFLATAINVFQTPALGTTNIALSSSQQSELALGACSSVTGVLSAENSRYSTYSGTKSMVVDLQSLDNNINNNQQLTC